jgi:mannose-6-phosphate isomerase
MQSFLRFRPLPQERVWGGRALETTLGRALPPGRPFGESWEIVDRPEAQSVIVGGELDGLTLRQAIERHGDAIMGPRWPKEKPFPILVKWLDCRERLSLQVHPPAEVAQELGGEPKTENWFVAAAAPDAHLIVGLKPGVTREQFEAAVAAGRVEDCVNRFPVAAGDSVLVRSGTVHAIDGGNLILEIQQNSDTTYRVDDWGRVGLDGKPRQLHVAESLKSILWDAAPPSLIKSSSSLNEEPKWLARLYGPPEVCPSVMLANTADFRIFYFRMKKGDVMTSGSLRKTPRVYPFVGKQPRILSVVEGRLTSAEGGINRGENVLLPYAGKFSLIAAEDTVVMVTAQFTPTGIYRRAFGLSQLLFTGSLDGSSMVTFGKHSYIEDRALVRWSGIWLLGAVIFTLATLLCGKTLVENLWLLLMACTMFAPFVCPACMWFVVSIIFRKRGNSRRFLALALAVLGTLLSWGALYFKLTGKLR